MCEPILLTTASLPNTQSSTRAAGTYLASSSSYTKTDTEALPKYLEYIEGTGWKVKESGLFFLKVRSGHAYSSVTGAINTYHILNNVKSCITVYYVTPSQADGRSQGQETIYLKKNSILDFSFEPDCIGKWSAAIFEIYAMFE